MSPNAYNTVRWSRGLRSSRRGLRPPYSHPGTPIDDWARPALPAAGWQDRPGLLWGGRRFDLEQILTQPGCGAPRRSSGSPRSRVEGWRRRLRAMLQPAKKPTAWPERIMNLHIPLILPW